MRKTLFFTFMLFLFFENLANAQEKIITGKVIDSQGTPLIGVSVLVVGTGNGVLTNADGDYGIRASEGQTLRFSYIGMETIEKKIEHLSTISVTLFESTKSLNEVIVLGYGNEKKASNTVGSVVKVSAQDLENKPVANVLDALQGKVSGLQIFSNSGEPSSRPSIKLHGVGSLSGNSSTPLIVLDGVVISESSLVSLNPNDFESVTVLKDASATSIYGSRAANGVLLFTTKKGKKGQGEITISTQIGLNSLANRSFFESLMNREEYLKFQSEIGNLKPEDLDFINKTYPNTDTDWSKVYYKKQTISKQTNISFSGTNKTGNTNYYVSGSLFDQEGLAYSSGFKRYTLRSNINSNINSWLEMGVNLSLGYDERQTNPTNIWLRGNLFRWALPYYSPVDENGAMYRDQVIPGLNSYHPAYVAEKIYAKTGNLQLNPTGHITITPLKNLTLKSQMGLDFYDARDSGKRLPSYAGNLGNGYVDETFSRGVRQTITNTAEYQFNVSNAHHFIALAGQEYIKYDYNFFASYSSGQSDDRLSLLNADISSRRGNGNSISEYAFNSYFGRLEYDFKNTYFLSGSVRRDGSSLFGENNKYANFWSVGAKWKLKNEAFLRDVDWINNAALFASTGTSGNSSGLSPYQSLALTGTSQYNNAQGYRLSSPRNNELAWESQRKTTIGLNLELFDRIRLNTEFYNRLSTDMLVSVPKPYTSGFTSVRGNVGSLQNRGIDVTLNFDAVKTNDFYLSPYVSLNYNTNKVIDLFQEKAYWVSGNSLWAVGKPITFFLPAFHSIDPATGAPRWYAPSEDVAESNFDENNLTTEFNNALKQNLDLPTIPPLNGGFGLSSGYKGFSLQVDFNFSSGKYMFNNDLFFYENPSVFPRDNATNRVNDYWKKPGDQTLYPSLDHQFLQFDSRLVENASFIRLKNVSLGYTLPQKGIENIGFVKGLKIYVTGRNLVTWTKYLGLDPEHDTTSSLGMNPNTKQISFGVNLTL